MALSKDEAESFRHESHKTEHKAESTIGKKPISKKTIFISISSLIVVLIIAGIGFSFANSKKPGPLDDFANALQRKELSCMGHHFANTQAPRKECLAIP